MRICIFTEVFLPKVDGIVNTLCHLLDHLERQGHACLLVAPQGAPAHFAGAQVLSVPAAPVPFYPELRIASPWVNLEREIDAFQPDLIHVVNPVSLGLPGVRYAVAHGIPLVASYHTDLAGFARRWGFGFLGEGVWSYLQSIHNQADLNLCPSQATRGELLGRGFHRLQVWSRGVDTSLFHPGKADPAWRARLSGGCPEAPLLLSVGRLSAEKRVDWLFEALQAYPQARLAIVGDGPQRVFLERKFAGHPVTFTGYLRGEDLAQAYASSDLLVFPAANETFGNVILEAMASGLPVVASQSGGPLDFVQHGQTGLLFAPEDTGAFLAQVGSLIQQPHRASQMGQAGRRAAEARSWDEVLDRLMLQYQQLITSRRHERPTRPHQPTQARFPAIFP